MFSHPIPEDTAHTKFSLVSFKIVGTQKRVSREVVKFLCLGILKSPLDMVLGRVALPEQDCWTKCPPEVPCNINHAVIL